MAQIGLYFLALFSLSTSPNWAKLNQMSPEVLGFWRLSIATLLIAPLVFLKKERLQQILSKDSKWIFLSGFFFFLHLWTYKYAAKNTLISNTMILFALNPVWSSLGGIVFFKERLKWNTVLSYLLAFISLAGFLYHSIRFEPELAKGNWSAVISAVFFGAYMIAGKKARQKTENIPYAFIQYGTCAFCFGVTMLFTGANVTDHTTTSWVAVAGLVLIPTFLGHFSMTYLVKHMDLSVITCGKLIEPLIASVMAYFIFHEVLRPGAHLAFAGTALSIVILFWPQLKRAFQNSGPRRRG